MAISKEMVGLIVTKHLPSLGDVRRRLRNAEEQEVGEVSRSDGGV